MQSKNGMKLKRDYNRGQVKLKSEVATCCNFEEQSKRSGARLQKKDFTGYSLTVVAGCNQSLWLNEPRLDFKISYKEKHAASKYFPNYPSTSTLKLSGEDSTSLVRSDI